uniref:Mitochondrial assembly of ribosomal large subunit protein 1 n=1 Tax=Sipha flava TaxID=143950 RepID=A0A2S2Q871_9HEMI
MLSLKIAQSFSRHLAANRISKRVLRSPPICSTTNTIVQRRYSNDDDKFVKPNNYKVFKDDDSSVILDVEEERALLDSQVVDEDFDEVDQFAGLDTSRGVSGVYEVEDLVEVLQKNNASNIFVVSIPANIRYVDYIVIASGKSQKHLMSIVEFVHKLFKKKRKPTDSIPRILNKKPLDWIALDIGEFSIIK